VRLDLHIHSTASDGSWSPGAVVRGAAEGGLDVIALTDHDTTAGFRTAEPIGRELNVQVVPGIEMSSTYHGRDVHVLGYFIDPSAESIAAHADRAGRRREERMKEMVDRLTASGIEVTYADVEAAAGPERVNIGRPHLARALVEAGYVDRVEAAFDSLIGDDSDAFVPTQLLEPVGAVELIVEGGGIPIWAHPPGDLVDQLLPELLEAGLRGLEVYRPRHRRSEVLRYEDICRTRSLLMSGGSDWHGPEGGSALGDFFVSAYEIEELLAVGGM
jgi:predicted metal-dependent phosphoesterase TrpH